MVASRTGAAAGFLFALLIAGPRWFAAAADLSPSPAGAIASSELLEDETLDSPAWRRTLRTWRAWLAVQNSYTPDETEFLQQEFDSKLGGMSRSQLADFKSDLDAKLALLMGPTGREYRLWLAETLSAASDGYRRKLRASLPDFAHLSASEVQAALDRFEYERSEARQSVEAQHQAQQRRAAAVREELRFQREASERALDRASRDANLQQRFGRQTPQGAQTRHYRSANSYRMPFFWFFWW